MPDNTANSQTTDTAEAADLKNFDAMISFPSSEMRQLRELQKDLQACYDQHTAHPLVTFLAWVAPFLEDHKVTLFKDTEALHINFDKVERQPYIPL